MAASKAPRTYPGEGRTAQKLARLLAAEASIVFGEAIEPDAITFAVTPGSARRNSADVCAWEAFIRLHAGAVRLVQCDDTMTRCIRHGVTMSVFKSKHNAPACYYAHARA